MPARTDVAEVITELRDQVEEFKSRHVLQQEEILDRLERLEIKGDTPIFQRRGKDEIELKAIDQFFRTGNRESLQAKGMTIAVDQDGGYTHVAELGNTIIKAVGEINPILANCRKVTTDANEFRQIFTLTRSGSGRAGESDTRSETGTPRLERVDATLYELYSYPKISTELLNSSQFDLAGFLMNDVIESFNEDLEEEFIAGNGTKKSLGILTQATSTAADTASPERPFANYQLIDAGTGSPVSSFNYDSLVTLVHALPVRYRANAKFYMSTDAVETARKLKDSQGMPIWRDASGGVAGAPQSIMGYPVIEVPGMPDVASQSKPVMFGDMEKAYMFISHSKGLGVTRDNITTPGMVKYYMRLPCVGYPADTRALKVLRIG